MTSRFRVSLVAVFLGILTLLGLNLFVFGPLVGSRVGEGAGNALFIGLRVLALVGFGFLARGVYGRGRWDAIRLGTLLEFFDHVVFRGVMLVLDHQKNPAAWIIDGQPVSIGTALFNVLFSFVVFFPAVFIITFVGSELGVAWAARRAGASQRRR